MKLADRAVDFLQRREVILVVFVAFMGVSTLLKWRDPVQPEDAKLGQLMGFGVYAVLALFAWRRNTLAIWIMTACILFAGLTSLYNSVALSFTDPLNTMPQNALSLVFGAYFTMSGMVIFRSRRIRIVGIEAAASPLSKKAEEGLAKKPEEKPGAPGE